MNEIRYETIIYWDADDQIFVVEVPELAGCKAHGATKQEALANAEQAAQLWLETAREDGVPIPEPKGRLLFAPRDIGELTRVGPLSTRGRMS